MTSFSALLLCVALLHGIAATPYATPIESHSLHSTRVATDAEANIAYFIQVSSSTITLLPRLLRVLWHEKNVYVVHFDKKIPKWQRDYSSQSIRKLRFPHATGDAIASNVIIMQAEIITYRGISMVINTMNAMQAALDAASDWHFFINISGSDYPLVSPANQRVFLASSDFLTKRRNFLTLSAKSWWSESRQYRATRLFTDTSLSMNDTHAELVDSYTKHPLKDILGFRFIAAESWMILHRDFVKHLLRDPVARRYFAAFAYISEPEEHFFATVAYNTPQFNESLVGDAMRNIIWTHNGKHSGQHPYHVDEKDDNGHWKFLPLLRKCGAFFTRKISPQNPNFLDIIDKQVSGVAPHPDRDSVETFLRIVRKRMSCRHPDPQVGKAFKCAKKS